MHHIITTTTALTPLGFATQRKLHRVPAGPFAGRQVALIQTAPNEIKLTWADRPYASWSAPIVIATDSADLSFDSHITPAGDLHLVYCEQTTNFLVTRKLPFASGSWSAGSKVYIYNGTQCFDPSLTADNSGTLWVAYGRFVTPNRTVHVKSSTDSGATWGSAPTDSGVSLNFAASSVFPRLAVTATHLFCTASIGGTTLSTRAMPLSTGVWGDPFTLITSTGLAADFDCTVSPGGIVGVAFSHTSLQYREYDGATWSAALSVDSLPGASVQLSFVANVPVITWLKAWQGSQLQQVYSERSTGVFSVALPLDARSVTFDSVLLYDLSAGSYVNRTTESLSSAAADLFHPSSGALLKDTGDLLYLGLSVPFRYVTAILSTVGVAGVCTAAYFDGVNWRQFTPASGAVTFGSATTQIKLWNDYSEIPEDWQRKSVNNDVRFWIKLEVTTPFTTGPVGSRLSAISDALSMTTRH